MTTGAGRYSRQVVLDEVGAEGQRLLREARVLVVGAGGLGSAALLYLAAAGVGTLGIVDTDAVALDNLHRQVVHDTPSIGDPKTESARRTIDRLNPDVDVVLVNRHVDSANAWDVISGWDFVVNGCDTFAARYALNDACASSGIPLVDAGIHRFTGEVTTILPGVSACFRCRHPEVPADPASCETAGVLGALPGVIGSLQATEVLKLIVGAGTPLAGRVLHIDLLDMHMTELTVERDPACTACSTVGSETTSV